MKCPKCDGMMMKDPMNPGMMKCDKCGHTMKAEDVK